MVALLLGGRHEPRTSFIPEVDEALQLREHLQGAELRGTDPSRSMSGCPGPIVWDAKRDNAGDPDPSGIYMINPSGCGVRWITQRVADQGWKPTLSPSGQKIAFISDRSGHEQVYLQDLSTQTLDQVTGFSEPYPVIGRPSWSPDEGSVVFDLTYEGNLDLYLLEFEAGVLRQITDGPAVDQLPSFSPSGESIVFGSTRSGSWNVWTLQLATQRLEQVTDDPVAAFRPAWSPDGSRIAFSSMRAGDWEIYEFDLDSGATRRLTDFEEAALRPSWSGDGRGIVFQVGTTGPEEGFSDWEIFWLEYDTGRIHRVTENDAADAHPDWNAFNWNCSPEAQ